MTLVAELPKATTYLNFSTSVEFMTFFN